MPSHSDMDGIGLVCHAFDTHCDWYFRTHGGDPDLMSDMVWLNHNWHMCYEGSSDVGDVIAQKEFIEEAHDRLNGLFHGMPSWIDYLNACKGIIMV